MDLLGQVHRRITKMIQGLEQQEREAGKAGVPSEKEKIQGDLTEDLKYIKGAHKKHGKRVNTRACSSRARENGLKLRVDSGWM